MIRVRVLGELLVESDAATVAVTSERQRAVLAVLAMHHGQSVQAERLLDLVWGDHQPSSGLGSLRFHINKLRNVLDRDRSKGSSGTVLLTTGAGYSLDRGSCAVDSEEFEHKLAAAKARLGDDPEAAAAIADEALELWRAEDAYTGFRYEQFAQDEIGRLAELRLQTFEVGFEAKIETGRAAEVVAPLQQIVEQHPYRERLVAQLMQALYATGRQVEALRLYGRTRERFVDELGIDVTPELQSTELLILEQDPQLVREQRERPRGNIPVPLLPLIGRELAQAEVADLLANRRLVTLIGPGGVGKTRLAIQVAIDLDDNLQDGAWFIDLSAARDEKGVAAAFQLAIRALTDQPELGREAFVGSLRSTSALLVLDNCEQVHGAVSSLCSQLLAECPTLKVLATSRSPLGVSGETLHQVAPLAVPAVGADRDAILASPAMALLAMRVQDHSGRIDRGDTSLRKASELIRALDGLPLAIELAARYLRVATLDELIQRLREGLRIEAATAVPDRHRSLEMALGWSYELLDEDQARMFAELSVFRGGFDLDAVQGVCEIRFRRNLITTLVELTEASLVAVDEVARRKQYRMLETVRQYAAEHLDPSTREQLRQRHSDHFTDLAKRAREAWSTPRQDEFMGVIRRQTANLQAATDYLLEQGAVENAGILVSGITQYWFYTGLHTEAIRTMRQVADAGGGQPLEPVRRVIESLVPLLAWGGRIDEAKELADQHAAILARREKPVPGNPQLGLVGTIAWCEGDLATVYPTLVARVEALAEAESPMTPTLAASVTFCLTWMGRLAEARTARDEVAEWVNEYSPPDGEPLLHDVDGWISFQEGNLPAARWHWDMALAGYTGLELDLNVAEVTQLLGWVDLGEGDLVRATTRLGAAQRVLSPLSMKPFEIRGYALLALAAAEAGELDRARVLIRGGVNLALEATNRLGQLLLVYVAGIVAGRRGDWAFAADLFSSVRRLSGLCSAALPQPMQTTMDSRIRELEGRGLRIVDGSDADDGPSLQQTLARLAGDWPRASTVLGTGSSPSVLEVDATSRLD